MQKKQFMILIILLVIGFASVTTTLVLNGNVGVGVELDDFDVIFVEALLDGKEDSKATISKDKKTITFTTDKFINKGNSARLDYKVKNTSTQYDADVTINCTNEANEYVTVTSSFDGNTIPLENPVNIKAQEVKSGYINAELTKAYAGEDTSIEISCKIIFTATSRETYAYSLTFDSNGGSKIDDKSVVLNDRYGELQEPVRIGYTFLGWYDENDNKVDEDTILDSKGNKTLYAKWEEKIYPVSIVTKTNGTSASNTLNVTYGQSSNIKITPSNNYYISSIECSDGYTVEEYNPKEPKYGEQTIKIKNNKVDKSGTCTFTFAQGIYHYMYTGSAQTFTVPLNGDYKVELWGASGSYYAGNGGMGSYTSGMIELIKNTNLYIQVGGQGQNGSASIGGSAGYNGGAKAVNSFSSAPGNSIGGGGGGATDIRLVNGNWNNFVSLKSRIMVAAGAGGSSYHGTGGHGGTFNGYSGNATAGAQGIAGYGYGASQTSGGGCMITSQGSGGNCVGSFGYANTTTYYTTTYVNPGSGGGGGYYGGGSSSTGISGYAGGSGGGGSSFISGYSGCNAIAESSTSSNIIHTGQPNHYSGYVFTNSTMIAGKYSMPNYSGTGTMMGNSGNGYAKITLVSID